MKKTIKMNRSKIITAKLAFTAVLFSLALASCKKDDAIDMNAPAYKIAQSEKLYVPTAVALPENLPAGNSRIATYYAEGVQKYKSQEKAGSYPVTYEWVFVAPQADLYDATNTKVGTHGAGPFWALSAADTIYAQHFLPAKTLPALEPNSIDWLLLMPKTGKAATGVFSNVAYIQRIATTGGKAPAVLPTAANQTTEVKYTAIYRFSQKNQ